MKKLYKKVQETINWGTGILLAALCVMVFVQVIMRKLFGHSFSWSEEMTRYFFVWIIFLGMNLGIRDGMQFKIDILEMVLNDNKKKALHVIQYALSIVACAAALYGSLSLVNVGMHQKSPTLQVIMGLIYLVFPLGFTMNIIELSRQIMLTLRSAEEERQEVE